MRNLKHLLSTVIREWDTLTLPQQGILEEWFGNLWQLFEREKTLNHTVSAGWYQTGEGMQFLERKQDAGDNPLIYNVELLKMPHVKKLDTRYAPVLSSTILNADALGTGTTSPAERASWRLDLWLNPNGECPVRDGIQFICSRENQPLSHATYELDFIDGRKLSAFEAFFVKSVFDASIEKIPTRIKP